LKIYVAAPWVCKDAARFAQEACEAAGHTTTSRWIDYHSNATPGVRSDFQELQEQALQDADDIFNADVFLILNLDKSEGKATELGLAYMWRKRILLVGKRTVNIFYHLPGIYQFDHVVSALASLK
jgi:hypothetical protein